MVYFLRAFVIFSYTHNVDFKCSCNSIIHAHRNQEKSQCPMSKIFLSQKLPHSKLSKPRTNQGQVMSVLIVSDVHSQPLPYFCWFYFSFLPQNWWQVNGQTFMARSNSKSYSTFCHVKVNFPLKALIVSTPKSKSNPSRFSIITRSSIQTSFPFSSQRLICLTLAIYIPPAIVVTSKSCFLQVWHTLWLTMVQ